MPDDPVPRVRRVSSAAARAVAPVQVRQVDAGRGGFGDLRDVAVQLIALHHRQHVLEHDRGHRIRFARFDRHHRRRPPSVHSGRQFAEGVRVPRSASRPCRPRRRRPRRPVPRSAAASPRSGTLTRSRSSATVRAFDALARSARQVAGETIASIPILSPDVSSAFVAVGEWSVRDQVHRRAGTRRGRPRWRRRPAGRRRAAVPRSRGAGGSRRPAAGGRPWGAPTARRRSRWGSTAAAVPAAELGARDDRQLLGERRRRRAAEIGGGPQRGGALVGHALPVGERRARPASLKTNRTRLGLGVLEQADRTGEPAEPGGAGEHVACGVDDQRRAGSSRSSRASTVGRTVRGGGSAPAGTSSPATHLDQPVHVHPLVGREAEHVGERPEHLAGRAAVAARSRRVRYSTLMPASVASSSRRSPGVRRRAGRGAPPRRGDRLPAGAQEGAERVVGQVVECRRAGAEGVPRQGLPRVGGRPRLRV